ncbi:hypothetical protein AYK26_03525 [Euryarchaeota archaeon SM23-78]|nr:MAG: hypothetical protein AYK26_03525 [Euryarchaeota archaeon SM23-78]MBW3000558.1 hypothetical protein [Candidatus Woesearchaeota archaeon]
MKYNLKAFNNAVKYYEKYLRNFKGKNIFIVLDTTNEKAFFSIPPLSRAASNLDIDMAVRVIQKTSKALDALIDVWNTFDELKKGLKNKKTKALDDYIKLVEKKTKGEFRKIFERPEVYIRASNKEFISNQGFRMNFKPEWFKRYRWEDLLATARIIWKQLYNLKKNEKVGFGFELIRKAKDMWYPLEDYLDSFAVVRTMFLACPAIKKTLSASPSRKTVLENSERTSELAATLFGCELEKNIDEPVFKEFKVLSKLLHLNRLETNDATFFIKGEGFPGKHLFGETIGYPTPNKKSRWGSPGGIIYQLPWDPQTIVDSRAPLCRIGFTDTLPIVVFIETNHIDWLAMKKTDDALIRQVNKSDKIIVDSDKTKLEVFLKDKKGCRREPLGSDVDVRHKLDPKYLKKGIKAGTYANIPGGEMFVTPEYMKGIFFGDVVISVDKSYVLNSRNPLIVKCDEKGYRIMGGPKKIINKINEKKKEAMKVLLNQEKHKALPAKIIKMKKDNFNKIGEFAINTNPKAKLCNYLIVNEKIAGMIHIALGSGFEDDRASVYHYDVVINAKEQKLDIYGLKGKNKLWMMRKGKLVV